LRSEFQSGSTGQREAGPTLRLAGGGALSLDRPRIMGVLNVTPDSFSDGGRFLDPAAAVEHALTMAAEGAELIDIGGESSRPGAERVPAEQQVRRVAGVIAAVRSALDTADHLPGPVYISVDTTRAAVAAAALDAGAGLVNDISGGREDPAMLGLVAERGAGLCLMHMRGQPGTMQRDPQYGDVVGEVEAFLDERRAAARAAGVRSDRLLLDPGIGFGKTFDHNLALLRALPRLAGLGTPLLLGTSRKRFLAALAGREGEKVEPPPYGGTAATTALGVAAGVRLFRVHDVALNRQAADLAAATTDNN
jgi:dihydropteroate synthase